MSETTLDEEIAAKWTLLAGEVLLNGKPASTSEVAKAIQEAKDRSIRERLAYERIKSFLLERETKAAMGERPHVAYATIRELLKSLDRYIATGREY